MSNPEYEMPNEEYATPDGAEIVYDPEAYPTTMKTISLFCDCCGLLLPRLAIPARTTAMQTRKTIPGMSGHACKSTNDLVRGPTEAEAEADYQWQQRKPVGFLHLFSYSEYRGA